MGDWGKRRGKIVGGELEVKIIRYKIKKTQICNVPYTVHRQCSIITEQSISMKMLNHYVVHLQLI